MRDHTSIKPPDVTASRDESRRPPTTVDGLSQSEDLVIPVVAEELTVETTRVARGAVRVHKRTEAREEVVDTPVVHEEVVVERIPVDRPVEGAAPEPHEEDGALLIPVLEEVVVLETRLMLREIVKISRRRTTTSAPQTVTLRREVVEVERIASAPTTLAAPKDTA